MESFLKIISAVPFLSPDDIKLFSSICYGQELKKGEFWARQNHHSEKIALIEKGYLRKFYMNEGKEVTDSFYFENSFTAELPSILANTPTFSNTIAEEDSSLTWFTYKELNELCKQSHNIEHFVRTMIERTFVQFYYRTVSFINKTPKERYDELINTFPTVLQRAKQYHIASYLGISAQHLSRLRSQ